MRSVVILSRLYPDRSELLQAFPRLTFEDIDAALTFYADNRAEIEQFIALNEDAGEPD